MPPKSRITKELILDAAFQVLRNYGIESVNARSISKFLGCSTQPVMYYFRTIDEIKQEIYNMSRDFHTTYLLSENENIHANQSNPSLDIGLNYIRFAKEESHVFRFLFQSNHFSHQNIDYFIDGDGLNPILNVMAKTLKTDINGAKEMFMPRFFMVHGIASMIANNTICYDEKNLLNIIKSTFCHNLSKQL